MKLQPTTETNEREGFISKEALALRLGRSVRTVENWQRRGIIPYVKCGRSILFKWTEVEAHLQNHFRPCAQKDRGQKTEVSGQRSEVSGQTCTATENLPARRQKRKENI